MTGLINLINKLPEFLRDYKELKHIMAAEDNEFNALCNEITQIMDNQFIITANENGIERFEKLLNIIPKADENLEERRFRVFSTLNEKLPYTEKRLADLLEILCGKDGYNVDINYEKCEICVKVGLASKSKFDEAHKLLERMMPVNMLIELMLKYNAWGALKNFTWGQLKTKTWRKIKEEVL